jgi:hypothetical protein
MIDHLTIIDKAGRFSCSKKGLGKGEFLMDGQKNLPAASKILHATIWEM